ncbi:tRNA-dihydrouridine synthase [Rhodoferax saidenbachensis]|uniref:tRNA-dihydrouridine(16) synthase n=1 Tax=Rhodoferax saidenbachensis TaxID=1484693 RepID=A0ABU1ZLA6_9BURK|nr:tRNA-dihydrouridine synthase [Rhodoferax saidenbachensis]MDR7306334.1 tRNA-dihydrouridine synthase C [Rhodoferax saidenbachensis]
MEGLLDFVLRDILTRVGGVEKCVSEFIRITHSLMSEKALLRTVPELAHGARTFAGVPVWPQLLGSDAVCLAENAARLAEMGAPGIDLNFGCPAKVVNRHGGGAALLQDPEVLRAIVAAVRAAVPASIPVTAKMRLGFNDDSLALDCARALEAGGAAEIVVHARTKAQGYRPPAYWDRVADVREAVRVPVVVNGEIWSVEDAQAAVAQSGCHIVMLGRGIVARPALARSVLAAMGTVPGSIAQPGGDWSWKELGPLMHAFWQIATTHLEKKQQAGRVKQWLNLLRRHYPEAQTAFDEMRTLVKPSDVEDWMRTGIPQP